MAFKTADGERSFGSGFRAKKYDEHHAPAERKEESRTNAMGMSKKSQPAAENKEDEGMNPESVVAEHGKATTVHVKHDHVANKHHVTSTHEDGHVHESDHASSADAHEHGKKLAGAENPEENPDEMGQEDNSSGMESFGLGNQPV